jgi:hypothetical protein
MKKNNGAASLIIVRLCFPLKVAALGKENILISCCYCLVYISKGKKAKVKLAILWSLLREVIKLLFPNPEVEKSLKKNWPVAIRTGPQRSGKSSLTFALSVRPLSTHTNAVQTGCLRCQLLLEEGTERGVLIGTLRQKITPPHLW